MDHKTHRVTSGATKMIPPQVAPTLQVMFSMVKGVGSVAVGPRTRELETSRLQAWDLLARGF